MNFVAVLQSQTNADPDKNETLRHFALGSLLEQQQLRYPKQRFVYSCTTKLVSVQPRSKTVRERFIPKSEDKSKNFDRRHQHNRRTQNKEHVTDISEKAE